jgi:hypothetical protein
MSNHRSAEQRSGRPWAAVVAHMVRRASANSGFAMGYRGGGGGGGVGARARGFGGPGGGDLKRTGRAFSAASFPIALADAAAAMAARPSLCSAELPFGAFACEDKAVRPAWPQMSGHAPVLSHPVSQPVAIGLGAVL